MGVIPQTSAAKRDNAEPRAKRSITDLLAPLDKLAHTSPNLIAKPGGEFPVDDIRYELPRYVFLGPKTDVETLRIGLFAAIHGDEPEGAHALVQFLMMLEVNPAMAAGYCLFVYPICNPTGFEDNTRHSRRGRDLNREFWNNSKEPEVQLLQREICHHAFDGIVSLHSDDTAHGVYGFVGGATLTEHLLKPALDAAELVLPRDPNDIIDGFAARHGIIREGYEGVLSAPPLVHPRPFEIILETPQVAPQYLQERALAAALQMILAEYQKLMAYAANL